MQASAQQVITQMTLLYIYCTVKVWFKLLSVQSQKETHRYDEGFQKTMQTLGCK